MDTNQPSSRYLLACSAWGYGKAICLNRLFLTTVARQYRVSLARWASCKELIVQILARMVSSNDEETEEEDIVEVHIITASESQT